MNYSSTFKGESTVRQNVDHFAGVIRKTVGSSYGPETQTCR